VTAGVDTHAFDGRIATFTFCKRRKTGLSLSH